MRAFDHLISARFICTMGHLVCLLILFNIIENNVEKGLEDGESSAAALLSCNFALSLGAAAIVFDFCGMFFGNTLFSPTVNVLQVFFHAVGGIFLSWHITQIWHYDTLWPIIVFTSFPTAIIEIGVLLNAYVFKNSAI
jgi:hypothetical protein